LQKLIFTCQSICIISQVLISTYKHYLLQEQMFQYERLHITANTDHWIHVHASQQIDWYDSLLLDERATLNVKSMRAVRYLGRNSYIYVSYGINKVNFVCRLITVVLECTPGFASSCSPRAETHYSLPLLLAVITNNKQNIYYKAHHLYLHLCY
jgi:hypothetical protein